MKETLALSIVLLVSTFAFADEPIPDDWLTVAEKTDFRATSTLAETEAFLAKIAKAAPGTVKRIADWAGSLERKGLVLVPVSAAVRTPRQG